MNEMVYFFQGQDQFLVENKVEVLINELNVDPFNVIKYDLLENELDLILEDLQTVSFFADKKIVVVKHAEQLSKLGEHDIIRFIAYLENPSEDVVLILMGSQAIETPENLHKAVELYAKIQRIDKLTKKELPSYVQSIVKKHHYTINDQAVLLLIERTNEDLLLMMQELEKLMLFSYETKEITEKAILLLVSRNLEEHIYELTTSLIEHNQKKSLEIFYDLMARNEEPLKILNNIVSKIRELIHCKLLIDKLYTQDMIAKHFQISSGRAYYLVKLSNAIQMPILENYLERLNQLDMNIKSGKLDKKIGLELFLLGG